MAVMALLLGLRCEGLFSEIVVLLVIRLTYEVVLELKLSTLLAC